jgi:hypothetical protein
VQFLEVAHRYQVPQALRKCELAIMMNFVTRETVMDVMLLADRFGLSDLLKYCQMWMIIEWDMDLFENSVAKLPDGSNPLFFVFVFVFCFVFFFFVLKKFGVQIYGRSLWRCKPTQNSNLAKGTRRQLSKSSPQPLNTHRQSTTLTTTLTVLNSILEPHVHYFSSLCPCVRALMYLHVYTIVDITLCILV